MKNEDSYLSSCTLFNVKMNILAELRGISSMLMSILNWTLLLIFVVEDFLKTRPNLPPTFTCFSLKAHIHPCIQAQLGMNLFTSKFEDRVWGPLISMFRTFLKLPSWLVLECSILLFYNSIQYLCL